MVRKISSSLVKDSPSFSYHYVNRSWSELVEEKTKKAPAVEIVRRMRVIKDLFILINRLTSI